MERIMSIVNLGLQCVGLMREEGTAGFEEAIKSSNNLHQLRKSAAPYKEEIKHILQPPTDLLSDLMKRLNLNDQSFQVLQSADDNEIEAFWEVLNQVDSTLCREDTTKSAVNDKADLQAFMSHCCQVRKYSFCIKKCGVDSCSICKPVRMDRTVFATLRHLPDPMISTSDPEHYLPFEQAMLRDTTDKDCPSLQEHKKKALSFSPSIQHVKNTNMMLQCEECQLWRLIFTKRKLTIAQQKMLGRILADVTYSCGATLGDLDLPSELSAVCVREHQCGDPMEKLYYSAGHDPIGYYCGSEDIDSSVVPEFYPMCALCLDRERLCAKAEKVVCV